MSVREAQDTRSILTREAPIRMDGDGDQPIRAVFATDDAVVMFDYDHWRWVPQILTMDGLQDVRRVPMLDSHNRFSTSDVLGAGSDLETEEHRLLGTLVFDSEDERAAGVERKVRSGFITDVSIGYDVLAQTYIEPGRSAKINGKTYKAGDAGLNVATDWRLREISPTPIGADDKAKIIEKAARSAGFDSVAAARSAAESPPTHNQEDEEMKRSAATNTPPAGAPDGARGTATSADHAAEPPANGHRSAAPAEPVDRSHTPEPPSPSGESAQERTERIREIRALGEQYEVDQNTIALADLRGTSVEEFRSQIADSIEQRQRENPLDLSVGLSEREAERYSITRVVRQVALNGRNALDGLEREVHDSLTQRFEDATGEAPMGVLIPADVTDRREMGGYQESHFARSGFSIQSRGMEAGDLIEGGHLVDTDLRPLLEYCRDRLYMGELGATLMTGLRGNLEWPRQLNELSATWVDEEGPCTSSTLNFGNLTMSPKRVTGSTCYTLQIVRQSSIDVEAINRRELAYAISKAIDRASLFGTGGLMPLGLLNETGMAAFTFGGPPTWQAVAEFCALIECCHCADPRRVRFASSPDAVSYTHLTLPTNA